MTEYLGRAGALGRSPDAVLIDAYVAGQPGGTGSVVADEVVDSIPALPRLIFAGGLTPENVAATGQSRSTVDGRRSQRGRECARPQGSRDEWVRSFGRFGG